MYRQTFTPLFHIARYGARASVIAFCSFIALAATGNATTIEYKVTDINPAKNIWRYDYTVGGGSFGGSASYSAAGFDVYFNPALYALLDGLPAGPNADWFVFSTAADPTLPANGVYTAQALADSASLAMPFSIAFTWLGSGSPGAQPFDVFGPTFLVIEQGSTTAGAVGIPEPRASLLLGVGVLGALAARRRYCKGRAKGSFRSHS